MVSVAVPIYGVEKYIQKCLESIVNQDYADFELILVNDGTKDNSIKIAEEYLKDKKVNWRVLNKENGGLASARNAGMLNATGEYVVCIDSDDAVSPDFIRNLKEALDNNSDADFAFSNFEFVKEQVYPSDTNNGTRIFTRDELSDVFLRRSVSFLAPTMMFRKEFLLKNDLLYNEKIKFSEDQPFIWATIFASNKSVYLNKKMYGYYVRENSIMTSSSADKILTSFNEYSNYLNDLKNKNPGNDYYFNLILPRWSLGALYTSANLTEFKTFKNIYNTLDGKHLYDKVKIMKDRNSNILAMVAKINPWLLYLACRSVKL